MIHNYLETLATTLTRIPREPIEEIVAVLQRATRRQTRFSDGQWRKRGNHFTLCQ